MSASDFNDALEAVRRGDLDRAEALAEKAIAAEPSANWQHLLGLIHCRRGNPAAGAEWLQRACEAEPGNIGFQVVAARALVDSGRPQEALAMPEPPPPTSAPSLALWQARAEAADAAGNSTMSERAWRTVAAAIPQDWRAWSNLGNALAMQGRWPEATDALRQASLRNPSERQLRRNLAAALLSADRPADALAVLDEWERIDGADAETAIVRGRCLAALQRFEEAERAYRQAMEHAPGEPKAWIGLGSVYERMGRSDRLGELIAGAADAGLTQEQLAYLPALHALEEGRLEEADRLLGAVDAADDPLRWYRLKSRIADWMGRYAEAFEAAEAMNRSVEGFESWVARSANYRGRLRAMAARAGERASQQLEPAPLTPVFLVGFPRSGTTLLDTFLMGHSKVVVLEELPLIMEAEKICPVAQVDNCSPELLTKARDAYFAGLDGHVPNGFDGVVIDKMPLNMLAVPLIRALFPGARFVFAQRNPCDAVLSAFMQSFVATEPMSSFLTIEGAADFYDAAMSVWTATVEADTLECHTIVYEDLVESPEATLKPLIEALGLEWEDDLLDHRTSARSRGTIVTPSYDQVIEPLSKGAVGRWRNYRSQLQPVLPQLFPWADRLGYPTD